MRASRAWSTFINGSSDRVSLDELDEWQHRDYLRLYLTFLAASRAQSFHEDCELHAPNTMHDFCCAVHDESPEYVQCQMEWNDKIVVKKDEDEQRYNFQCVSEGVYNKTNYLAADRTSLRLKDVIKDHLQSLHVDKDSCSLMFETFEFCEKHAKEMLQHEEVIRLAVLLAHNGCHPYPGLVFECVSNELSVKCPPWQFHDIAQCQYVRSYLQKCLKLGY